MITVPRLRDRIEDIPFLAMKFMTAASMELGKQMRELSKDAIKLLSEYPWPGNVRELKNVIRRAVLSCENGIIRPEHIEFIIGNSLSSQNGMSAILPLKQVASNASRNAERETITKALTITMGNKSKAARLLEVDYKTLLTKIRDYNIGT